MLHSSTALATSISVLGPGERVAPANRRGPRSRAGAAVPLNPASLLAVRLLSLSRLWLLSEVVVSDRRISIDAMAPPSRHLLVRLATICVAEAILFSPDQARHEEAIQRKRPRAA